MNPLALALRILRADRRSRLSAVLTSAGVAIGTVLVVLLLTLPDAAAARGERFAWQYVGSHGTPAEAVALVDRSSDVVGSQPITRLDVAASGDASPEAVPVAPGIPEFPASGEVLLSPALADLVARLPPAELGDRFPGAVIGVLGQEALSYPEQLVAVVGHHEAELSAEASPVAGLIGDRFMSDIFLITLSMVGLAVLAVPSLVLVASSARLTAARRERRLASMRLAGATPGQVLLLTAVEAGIAAAAGTVVGLSLTIPVSGLMSRIPWQGGTWLAGDFVPEVSTLLLVGLGVPLLVILAAVLGLRRVVSSPLGVVIARRRRGPSAWRLVVLVSVGALFAAGLIVAQNGGGIGLLIFSMAAIVLSASVVGPWLTSVIGVLFTTVWRRPSTLLAGRRLRDAPQAAYRSASGVVLAVFVGALALTVLPGMSTAGTVGRSFQADVLYGDVPTSEAEAIAERIRVGLTENEVAGAVATAGRARLITGDGRHEYPALVLDCPRAVELTRLPIGRCSEEPGVWVGSELFLPDTGLRLRDVRSPRPAGPSGPDTGSNGAMTSPGGSADAASAPGVPLADGGPVTVHTMAGSTAELAGSVLVEPALVPDRDSIAESSILVSAPADQTEVVRTVLSRAAPGVAVNSLALTAIENGVLLDDLRRVTILGLSIAALLACASTIVTSAGSVLDRRQTLGALTAAGASVSVLARALRTEAALPALAASLGAAVVGFGVGAGVLWLLGLEIEVHPSLAVPVAVAVAVSVSAAWAAGRVLRNVSGEPFATE
ncbi:energy-converting hydrogenase Eha subunit A [Actinoalloteichus hoggarensis]|uniref:FtsX-like permease family protein n=1 Tax=Actinoalloteichus hoggarensis TaxID=1470176 RepID=A0A221WB99_9PSEU|nr:FtsX-like permease family protein [Actinoalloteichus hoggarensis]ASO23064.1 FtsX-like permease family protein [Actinoalloteichus hoggarensis]MBB5922669.1 energy-converting hydrogenase Eha subunit A [Actinoalloteichus hoggarensis]